MRIEWYKQPTGFAFIQKVEIAPPVTTRTVAVIARTGYQVLVYLPGGGMAALSATQSVFLGCGGKGFGISGKEGELR